MRLQQDWNAGTRLAEPSGLSGAGRNVLGSEASRAGWPELVLERDVQWKNERN